MESQTQLAISSENPVDNSAKTLVKNNQNPPKTLISYDQDKKSEISVTDNTQKNLDPDSKPENGIFKIEVLKLLLSEKSLTKTHSGTDKEFLGGEEETSSKCLRRKKRSDPPPSESNDDAASRKKKSWWADDAPPVPQLPDFMMNLAGIEFDPEIQVLSSRLIEINRLLLSGLPLEDRHVGARSPSPEPLYDVKGIRINTWENRAKERLGREKQDIIQQMIKKNPAFRPPADYRPPKVQKKLYIPMKEYPGYNFIGLVIGAEEKYAKENGERDGC